MTKNLRVMFVGCAAAVAFVATLPISASETIDYDSINKIKQQGMGSSPNTAAQGQPSNSVPYTKVMEIMSYLTDVYGPRLTGSPNITKAGEWAVAKMKEWGL